MFPHLQHVSHKHTFFLFGPSGTEKKYPLETKVYKKPMSLVRSFRLTC
jgi:hypothetical protein